MKPPGVIVSRCDRIGDLVLSLPVLGFLQQAGVVNLILHCSAYAKAVGQWAQHNGLCQTVVAAGEAWPEAFAGAPPIQDWLGLSLFHSDETVALFRKLKLRRTLGPRSKLSAIWSYKRSIAQHRSRVEKSEMEYNLDLARELMAWVDLPIPEFRGLPSLQIPPTWTSPVKSPDVVMVVSNRGSALNWTLEKYIALARDRMEQGRRVHFLVSGTDSKERMEGLESSGILKEGAEAHGDFSSLDQLIVYLARAGEVVASSTGPLHIAHAAGVPVLGIYPTIRVQSFRRWRPHGYWHKGGVQYVELGPELGTES